MRKKCSSDREKVLKFEAENPEFAKSLRSLEQFIQTVKGQLFQHVPGGFSDLMNWNNYISNWKKIFGI